MEKGKIRAVDYDRVSTEEEAQVNALSKQVQENMDVIKSMGWIHVGSYIDEGKSGTTVKHRTEYQRLLDDMELDLFDIICVKSQDRLMRNTKDWYLFLDKLVTNGKKLYFYIERKFYTPDDALITGIKAILAEDYSRELSKKLSNHYSKMAESAKLGREVKFPITKTLGLKRVNGDITVVEHEADIVRLIFKRYLEGNGTRKIMAELKAKGYKTRAGKDFCLRAILTILKNERYCGTVILNKTKKDFDTKKTIENPQSEWVYLYDVIPKIVSKEDYEAVQALLADKRQVNNADKAQRSRGLNRGKTPFSGKCYCGECGGKIHRDNCAQAGIIYWRCGERNAYGKKDSKVQGRGCNLGRVRNEDLEEAIEFVADKLVANREQIKRDRLEWLENLKKRLLGGKDLDGILASLEDLKAKKARLLDLYLDQILTKADYLAKSEELDVKIDQLEENVRELRKGSEDIQEIQRVIDNIDEELDAVLATKEDRISWVIENTKKIIFSEDMIDIRVGAGEGKSYRVYNSITVTECNTSHS